MLDFLIRNGHVVDPAEKIDSVIDIGIKDGHIADIDVEGREAKHVIDAKGRYVLPGLIDVHTHVFRSGSILGVAPDVSMAYGVTTVVDAGSAGVANYRLFHEKDAVPSLVKVYSLCAYNDIGQTRVLSEMEDYRRESVDTEGIKKLMNEFPDEILGLKMRFQKEVVGDNGICYLREMVETAEQLSCPVVVHTTNSPAPAPEVLGLLRKGDVYCHCYQGRSNSIIDENGRVYQEAVDAQKRGVLFDAANGMGNFEFATAKAAIDEGFLPDLIGSDQTTMCACLDKYAKSLPFVMSKFLHLGMSLYDVVACVTKNAAEYIGNSDVGTLKPGAAADVAIFEIVDGEVKLWDSHRSAATEETGKIIMVPCMTWINGNVVYSSNNFCAEP